MLSNIPREMLAYESWVVWRYEDRDGPKPTKVAYSPRTNKKVDSTQSHDYASWVSYDEAVKALDTGWWNGIGFVLSERDPYCFIDLDDTHGDKEAFDRQMRVYSEFDSYAELSPSGNGLHIIIKGAIPVGRRRSHIEIYSQKRFMTMTGNIYRDVPIKDHREMLAVLYAQMSEGKDTAKFYAGLEDAKLTDAEVLEMASSAANAEKFNGLYYDGDWQKFGYPSQSEADFALVDIIAFYSENRKQVQNIFLKSKLAERDKSRAQYRIDYMLDRCFDRMLPPVDIDGLRNLLNEAVEAQPKQAEVNAAIHERQALPQPISKEVAIETASSIYAPPPGLVGMVAQFIYAQAARPVGEIALAGAIGFLAGIVGRSYNVSGTGLNQYVLLLAPTGTGKEAIASGTSKLMAELIRSVPAAADFIGPSKINSEQALIKYLNKAAISFVSVVGEFGIRIREMSSHNAAPHMANLLALLLDLFNKSGEGNVLRPSIYADADKNTSNIYAPAVSIIGESVPEKFYEVLDESMISSGLLPRFTLIEYKGRRTELNEQHNLIRPTFELIQRLGELAAFSLQLNSQHKAVHVQMTPEAKAMLDNFNRHADANINNAERDVLKQLWNRSHIKALKLAALVAVGCDPYNPTITLDNATWAINFVTADVRNLLARFDAGEIGVDNDETKQIQTVMNTIRSYVVSPFSEVEAYAKGLQHLHSERVIPYAYLQRKLASVSVFRRDKMGSSFALKRVMKTLAERGDLTELPRSTMSKQYKTTAVSYMITNTKAFDL